MRTIFLDIDGVVVTSADLSSVNKRTGWYNFNKTCIKRLKTILERTGAVLVISSSWRTGSLEQTKETLGLSGMKSVLKYMVDETPRLDTRMRGYEIQHWLDNHPEVEEYLILDDDSDMLDSQKGNFIQTSMKEGLTEKLALEAISFFNNHKI